MPIDVIILTKVFHPFGFTDAVVLTCYMVWHEVHYHLQSSLVRTLYKSQPLAHAVIHIDGNVWVYVIIVGNGVWRAGDTFHHVGMLARNAITSIIGLRGVTNHARKPNMSCAESFDSPQRYIVKVIKFTTPVLFNASPLLISRVAVAEETGKNLIDDRFHSSIPCALTSRLILAIIP